MYVRYLAGRKARLRRRVHGRLRYFDRHFSAVHIFIACVFPRKPRAGRRLRQCKKGVSHNGLIDRRARGSFIEKQSVIDKTQASGIINIGRSMTDEEEFMPKPMAEDLPFPDLSVLTVGVAD